MKKLMLVVVCSSLISSTAIGGDFYGVANLASYHVKTSDFKDVDYNEKTFGLGIEYVDENRSYQIGRFKNSVYKMSNYVAAAYTPLKFAEGPRLGAMLGIVDGYPRYNKGGIAPLAGLLLQYSGPIGFNFLLIPPTAKNASTFNLQMKIKF